ncbi:MAG: metal-sulfur cluster assembly factor [Deltaproteobacteria bacterium]|nr:metal-sulfur cluster assembly factor [Deltaproteobacteria bacterium]
MISQATIIDALRTVHDPEVGINLVDLGLVYDVRVGPGVVDIDITLTSPACPLADMVVKDALAALSAVMPGGTIVDVNLVWTPPWSPDRMSDEAKAKLGW